MHASRLWAVLGIVYSLLTAPAIPNPITAENAKPGTRIWQLSQPATNHAIEGYASLTSVNRGGSISLFVSTTDPAYNLQVFRLGWYGGLGARQVAGPISVPGCIQMVPTADPGNAWLIECAWTNPYVLTIPNNPSDPTDWAGGLYLAKLTGNPSGNQSYIPFVVRDDGRPSDLLFQSSVTTFQAYNSWGGNCLYAHSLTSCSIPVAQKVSFNRPYEQTSGYPGAQFYVGAGELFTRHLAYTSDYCDSAARGQSAAAWEYNMVRFLEREGYDVSYCTDVDSHENGSLALSHKAFLSIGHDEYWSQDMRNHVEAARDMGVNLAFFSANTCYWQIRFEPSTLTGLPDRTIVCYKDPYADPLGPSNPLSTGEWRNAPVNRPENAMIGVMYDLWPVDAPLVVTNTSHWIFNGTGLQDGDSLGRLVGYEADRFFPAGPAGLTVLAQSHTPEDVIEPNSALQYANATMYTAPSGAKVFAGGSIQWAWGLDDYSADPALGPVLRASRLSGAAQQVTRNVLDAFVGKPLPPSVRLISPEFSTVYLKSTNSSLQLSAIATDNAPNPSTPLWTAWAQVDGPGTVAFADTNSLTTTAGFNTEGVYHLSLQASNSNAATTVGLTVVVGNVGFGPAVQVRFAFSDPPGSTTTTSDTNGGGATAVLQMLNSQGVPADYHGPARSGPAGLTTGSRALDFSSNTNQGGTGPVATTTNGSLGFGTITNFIATIWFQPDSSPPASSLPTIFLLGNLTNLDCGTPDSVGLRLLDSKDLQYYISQSQATAAFASSLTLDAWAFAAIVYDGKSLLLYQGSETSPTMLAGDTPAPGLAVNLHHNAALTIGNRPARDRSFAGRIADFRFYQGAADRGFVEAVRQEAAGPSGLAATAGNNQVGLAWNKLPGAASYNVKRATVSGGPYTTISSPESVTGTNYVDTTAANGTTYYYVVSAKTVITRTDETANSPQEAVATPVPCSSLPSPVPANNGPIFTGMTLNLTASTVSGAGYQWTGPNDFMSTNQNPSLTNATTNCAGLYSVVSTMTNCFSAPASTLVTVNPLPYLTFTRVGSNFSVAWPSGTLQFTTNASGPWYDLPAAYPPFTASPAGDQEFFRLKLP